MPKPLPIALDYRPALLSRAGIGRATRELARALAQRDDVDVHLFGHSFTPARVATSTPGAHLHRLPIPGRALPWLARCGLGADRLAGGARLFHWTDYVHPPVTRARLVLTVHDLAFVRDSSWHGPDAARLRERTATAIRRAAAVVVPSTTTATDVREFAPDAEVAVIPFGADHVPRPDAIERSPFAKEYALCVGTIEPRKHHLALLAAWRLLPAPRPLLVVVGAIGWQCDAIVAELLAAEREGLVAWRRDATDDELWALLGAARLLVYPSAWEGFGFPPLEAMALGVPVVANDTPALRELGADAMGFAAATDAAAFAAACARLLRDRAAHAAAAAAGRQRAACFRWSACAAAHAALYHRVTR